MFFEGDNRPLIFATLFLVSEWITGYYLAFNFQARTVIVIRIKNKKHKSKKKLKNKKHKNKNKLKNKKKHKNKNKLKNKTQNGKK